MGLDFRKVILGDYSFISITLSFVEAFTVVFCFVLFFNTVVEFTAGEVFL